MCLFNKKKNSTKTKEDSELIEANAKSIEALIILSNTNYELVGTLKEIQNKIKYLIPSADTKVVDQDKKIRNYIGDLRIALTKSDGQNNERIDGLITDIKIVIADRNARM